MYPFSYIELSQKNLIHNIQAFTSFLHPDAKIAAVIKANAYGHGQHEIVHIIDPYVAYFQIDDYEELLQLKQINKKQVLLLGYVPRDVLQDVIEKNAAFALYDKKVIPYIGKITKTHAITAHVHIMVDAYLGREGVLLTNLPSLLAAVKQYPKIHVDGIYAHFANIEDTTDFSHAKKQIAAYAKAVAIMQAYGFTNFHTHIAATSGILVHEKQHLYNSIARLGIGMYGFWPSTDLQQQYQNIFQLQPVMRWISHIAQVKTVPPNYTIGYGLTYVTKKTTKIALIPQGYSDGYDRGLSNRGEVLIHGKRCKVLGRISMNMFVVDVTTVHGVKKLDEVVLLGKQEEENISTEEIAHAIDTIQYEVVARISPFLPRIIVE